jgi:uncharacterized protein YndB with AHSA1/START domain
VDATTESTAIERQVEIAASPETVWELLTDPEEATRWMGLAASFDLRPGGEYRVTVLSGNVACGEFVEIDAPRRLVLTWGWEPGSGSSLPPGSTTVEFELVPNGEGTLLRFSHRDLPAADAEAHGHGWDHYLGRLALVGAGGDPGRDPWLDRPVS